MEQVGHAVIISDDSPVVRFKNTWATEWGPRPTRAEVIERRFAEARRTFAAHQLQQCSPDRWRLATRDTDGRWRLEGWTEVVALGGGRLLVHGDYEHCMFQGHASDSAEGLVRWLGRSTTLGYIHEKATIAMGNLLVDDEDDDALADDLAEMIYDRIDSVVDERGTPEDERQLKEVLAKDDRFSLLCEAHRYVKMRRYDAADVRDRLMGHFESEDLYGLGRLPATPVFCAHAAVARLCALLDTKLEASCSAS